MSEAGASLAVVPVRGGVLPFGADETVAEAGGAVLLIGSGCRAAAAELQGLDRVGWLAEVGGFSPGRWARLLTELLTGLDHPGDDWPGPGVSGHILLPASPDGRDLAPRLAAALGRPYVSGAIRIDTTTAERTRYGGRVADHLTLSAPIVATLQAGVRGVDQTDRRRTATSEEPDQEPSHLVALDLGASLHDGSVAADPSLVAELPADPSTMDLSEADRIIGGGAGLGSAEVCGRLAELAPALSASVGGTRVITDWGWLPVERQIGTTGVTVDPSLYIAVGVSGAVQHTAGLGTPAHVISVNTDPHCPMMTLADLAIVCDGPEFLDALLALVAADAPASGAGSAEHP